MRWWSSNTNCRTFDDTAKEQKLMWCSCSLWRKIGVGHVDGGSASDFDLPPCGETEEAQAARDTA